MKMTWAKRRDLPGPYSLEDHSLDTAAAAHVLWNVYLPIGVRRWLAQQLGLNATQACAFVAFVAGLHDVGKACPCFQDQWPPKGSADHRSHEHVGYLSLPTLLSDFAEVGDSLVDSVAHRIAEIVGSHHGDFQAPDRRAVRWAEDDELLGGVTWHARRRAVVDLMIGLLEPVAPVRLGRPAAVILSGLVILADWIASDVEWIKRSQWNAPKTGGERWRFTVRSVRERILKLDLTGWSPGERVTTQSLIGKVPNGLQRSIEAGFRPSSSGILLITAPTGAGKTVAAIVAADRLGHVAGRPGLVMCLPTQATTNAMWEQGRRFTDPATGSSRRVTLAHSTAALHLPYRRYCADDEALNWLNGPHRALLAGWSVVTIDQLLLAGLATRFNMLRLFALTGKTVVIDEVHTCQPYMLALLARVLSWCGHLGIPVVLLSATVPRHIARDLTAAYLTGADPERLPEIHAAEYPGWIWHGADGAVQRSGSEVQATSSADKRSARIEYVRYTKGSRTSHVLRYAQRVQREGGCLAIICGTVPTAQKTFTALRRALGTDTQVMLLHARLPHRRRLDIEGEVERTFGKDANRRNGRRPERAILVCTPLIEQSLDLDFDLVITDLAPIAFLIQRLGRCLRHARPREERPVFATKPTVVVLDTDGDEIPRQWLMLHSEYELRATRRLLATPLTDFTVPDDVDNLVQAVHDLGLPPFDGAAAEQWRERGATTAFERGLARLAAVPPPHMIDSLADLTRPDVRDTDAATRLGIDNAVVIPVWTDASGRLWLNSARTVPLPLEDRPTSAQVRSLVDKSIRCPAEWVTDLGSSTPPWRHPYLRDARILPVPYPGLTVDAELGLVRGREDDL